MNSLFEIEGGAGVGRIHTVYSRIRQLYFLFT
jgi:hypothetical protein